MKIAAASAMKAGTGRVISAVNRVAPRQFRWLKFDEVVGNRKEN